MFTTTTLTPLVNTLRLKKQDKASKGTFNTETQHSWRDADFSNRSNFTVKPFTHQASSFLSSPIQVQTSSTLKHKPAYPSRFGEIIIAPNTRIIHTMPMQDIHKLFGHLNELSKKYQFAAPHLTGGFALSWLEALKQQRSDIKVRDLDILLWMQKGKQNENVSWRDAFVAFTNDLKQRLETDLKIPFEVIPKPDSEKNYPTPRAIRVIVPKNREERSKYPILDLFMAPSQASVALADTLTNKHALRFPLTPHTSQEGIHRLLKDYETPVTMMKNASTFETPHKPDRLIFKMATLQSKLPQTIDTSQVRSLIDQVSQLSVTPEPTIKKQGEVLRRTLRLLFVPHPEAAFNMMQRSQLLSKCLPHTPLNNKLVAYTLLENFKKIGSEPISDAAKLQKAVKHLEETLTSAGDGLIEEALKQLQVAYIHSPKPSVPSA